MSAASLRGPGGKGPRLPRPSALRLVGREGVRATSRVPDVLGARFDDGAADLAVVLRPDDAEDAATVARALPDPAELPPGTLVLVLPEVGGAASFAGRLLAAIGRTRAVPRVLRCTALVARGFVEVGGGVDPASRTDLAWGRAPP